MKHVIFSHIKQVLALALTGSLLTAMPLPTVSAEDMLTYTLVPDKTTISASEIAAGDVIVHAKMMITNDPGTAAIIVTFGTDAGLSIENDGFANPYCYGDGTSDPIQYYTETHRAVWYSSGGDTGYGIGNEIIYDASLPFIEFDVRVPQNTAAGTYNVFFDATGYTDEATGLTTASLSTSNFTDNIITQPPVTLEVNYVGFSITVQDASAATYGLGDLNEDGKVDANDAVVVLKNDAYSLTGMDYGLTDQQKTNGDLNNDGSINAKDAVIILKYDAMAMVSDGLTMEAYLATL